MDRTEVIARFQAVLDDLLARTRASRTTLRLDAPNWGLHVDDVAAEARRDESVRSIKGQTSLDQRNAAAVKWLVENRRTFVMSDTLNPWDPAVAPEREVIEIYGIRSEMVSLVLVDGEPEGWVSVHWTEGPREWTEAEIAAIEDACRKMAAIIAEGSRA